MELQGHRVTAVRRTGANDQARIRSKPVRRAGNASSRRQVDDRAEEECKSSSFSGLSATGSGITSSRSSQSVTKGSRLPTTRRIQSTSGQLKFSTTHGAEGGVRGRNSQSREQPKSTHGQLKPTSMRRAKSWNFNVEEHFRLQNVGWRDLREYEAAYGEPERWASTSMLKCVRVKDTGYYTYWDAERECEDKHVPKVKLYEYDQPAGGSSSGSSTDESREIGQALNNLHLQETRAGSAPTTLESKV